MRYAFRAVDFGASIVFMAMCAKAFWRYYYEQRQKFPLVENSPSLVPAKVIKFPRPGHARPARG